MPRMPRTQVSEARRSVSAHMRSRRINDTVEVRFWAKVDKTGECWLWLGLLNGKGYGTGFRVSKERRSVLAHRWAWEMAHGPIPEGLEIDHLCRNRACVRLDHLEAVEHAINVQRGLKGVLYTHCKQGHPMITANLKISRRTGARSCRECHRSGMARWREQRLAS